MWGSDFPHDEGTYPFSAAAISHPFQGVDTDEVRQLLGTTAAQLYGFDLDALAPLALKYGPRVDEVSAGIDQFPIRRASPLSHARPG